MKKVLCIGHSAYDITMQTDGYPKENIKYRVSKKVECGGGPAANAAYLLTKWGMDRIFYLGAVGNDLYGKRIIEEFMEIEMNLDYVQAIQNSETPLSLIVANEQNGSRTLFNYNTKSSVLDMDRIEYPHDIDVILTDGHELDATLRAIEHNEEAITIIDAGRVTKNNLILCKIVDYLVGSQDFAEDFTGIKIDIHNYQTLEDTYLKLEEEFKNTIVITLGEDGSLYKEAGKVIHVPSLKVKAVDSTGAGDIYHGGFTYAMANGYSLIDAIKIGSISGALSVTKLGGRISIPTLEEVLNEYDNVK